MIVISGALLVIAVVFLGIGLHGPLGWVYASIVVSVLSFVFLLIGVRQRRDGVGEDSAPPVHPVGQRRPDANAPGFDNGDVTLVPAAAATSADSPATPAETPAVDSADGKTQDVPLVPATRKSAAKKATASKPAAKKAAPAKKTAARKSTTGSPPVRNDPTADPAPRKATTRKAAASKPPVAEGGDGNGDEPSDD